MNTKIKVQRIKGKPCRHCGSTERYATSGRCVPCKQRLDAIHNAKKLEKIRVLKRHDVE